MSDRIELRRSTWRPPMAQRWWLAGLPAEIKSCWTELLAREGRRRECHLITAELSDWSKADTDFSSGIVIHCENSTQLLSSQTIETFRRIHPKAILVGWGPDLAAELIPIWLELGIQFLARSRTDMAHLVPHIVEKAESTYVETAATLARIQRKTPLSTLVQLTRAPKMN